MVAVYEGSCYSCVRDNRGINVITKQAVKAFGKGFFSEGGIFYKPVGYDEIDHIYSTKYVVTYDTGIENVPVEWEVELYNGKLLLRYKGGLLPGWQVENKNVCIRCVEPSDIASAKEIKMYKKKDGVRLDRFYIVESQVEPEELPDLLFRLYNM